LKLLAAFVVFLLFWMLFMSPDMASALKFFAAIIGFLLFWVLMLGYAAFLSMSFKKIHPKLEKIGLYLGILGFSALYAGLYEQRYPDFETASFSQEFSDGLYFDFLTPEGLVVTALSFLGLYLSAKLDKDESASMKKEDDASACDRAAKDERRE